EVATWSWRARDTSGNLLSGATAAASAQEVAARLRKEGKVVLGVKPGAAGMVSPSASTRSGGRSVPRSEVLEFSRQVSVMLEAGVSLTEALEAFSNQSQSMRISSEIDSVRQEVSEGDQLSSAFARRDRTFPPVATGLMRAAEAVGDLPGMFSRLADWIGREQRILRQVRAALAYPAVLAVVGSAITVFLVTAVLPRFEAIYAQRAADLPPLTEWVLSIGRFISGDWMFWVPGLLVVGLLALLMRDSDTMLGVRERVRFDLPVVRNVCRPAQIGRVFRTWSILLAAGVPLLDAVSICRDLAPWRRWAQFWDEVEKSVREGRGVSEALQESTLVSPSAKAMVSAGERGGRLPETLAIVADAADEELDVAVKRTSTLVEPLAIVVLGSVVGVVAIALLLPVFKMSSIAG
ncbi:MAG: type II secretion system F family protein, partial [Phycisphaerales bacterium]|nr:type II secretion system F family protein [Phycisphaerales bacterium]